MGDTYKGESYGKRWARFSYWRLVRDQNPEAFLAGRHWFFASREGGDFGVANYFGAPFRNLIGVERVESAASACSDKWGKIWSTGNDHGIVQRGDIVDELDWYAENEHAPIASVFLDFCQHIDRESLLTTIQTWIRMPTNAVLGVAFQKGREKKQAERAVAHLGNRAKRRRDRSATPKRLRGLLYPLSDMLGGRVRWDTKRLLDEAGRLTGAYDPTIARWSLVRYALLTASAYRYCEPLAIIDYHSRTDTSGGVPMIILMYRVLDLRNSLPNDAPLTMQQPQRPKEWVRNQVVQMPSRHAALAFNISPRQVAAWKAVATRSAA